MALSPKMKKTVSDAQARFAAAPGVNIYIDDDHCHQLVAALVALPPSMITGEADPDAIMETLGEIGGIWPGSAVPGDRHGLERAKLRRMLSKMEEEEELAKAKSAAEVQDVDAVIAELESI